MYERLDSCPSCGNHTFTNRLICTDHLVSQESFVIVECEQCHLNLTNPRPKPEHIGQFYQSDKYISHNNRGQGIVGIAYNIARSVALKGKLKLINRYHEKPRLLDYGCGTGHFLKTCKNAGLQVTGVEPDINANASSQSNTEQHIFSDISEISPQQHFDIITLWHVLEHIPNIKEVVQQLKDHLTNDGYLIVAVPNKNSWDATHYNQEWAAYDVPRHLYHFDQNTIKSFMLTVGLKREATIPMKLDAYYVSLLSENHLGNTGISKYYKSMINGYKSNSYAAKNNDNYSSLIYVFKK